jgi:hypothetical protein
MVLDLAYMSRLIIIILSSETSDLSADANTILILPWFTRVIAFIKVIYLYFIETYA